MNVLVICQGPAYGDERSYNGLRLAGALAKRDGTDVKVFLIGDAAGCAIAGSDVMPPLVTTRPATNAP